MWSLLQIDSTIHAVVAKRVAIDFVRYTFFAEMDSFQTFEPLKSHVGIDRGLSSTTVSFFKALSLRLVSCVMGWSPKIVDLVFLCNWNRLTRSFGGFSCTSLSSWRYNFSSATIFEPLLQLIPLLSWLSIYLAQLICFFGFLFIEGHRNFETHSTFLA